eukprot:m.10750 g.10750  ORF g.10750 m.10750 type:complete len:127 (-) comp2554_c1_seq1:164-544(-)
MDVHARIDSAPVVSPVQFLDVVEIPGLWEEFVTTATERRKELHVLRQKLPVALDTFGKVAHTLRSFSSMLGASRLALVCAKLETFARDGPHQNLQQTLAVFDTAFELVFKETYETLHREFSSRGFA